MRDVLRRYLSDNGGRPYGAEHRLSRPGPIQGGMIDDFIERKWGRRKGSSTSCRNLKRS